MVALVVVLLSLVFVAQWVGVLLLADLRSDLKRWIKEQRGGR